MGVGSLDDWPAEASLLNLGIQESEARTMALRYGQNAFIYGVRSGLAQVVWIDE
jgi:hypothetical protein